MKNNFIEENFDSDRQSINELFQRSLIFRDSRQYIKFFSFIAKFTYYSHYNAMLVYIQNPEVEFFGSPSFWKKEFSRRVKENARPYIALFPFGPCMLVYDIYDTEGTEPPEKIIERGIQGGVFKVNGHIPSNLLSNVVEIANSWGISVRANFLRFNFGGYIAAKIGSDELPFIVLHEKATPEESFKTLAHELGHLFLGHLGEKRLVRKIRTKTGKGKEETIVIKNRDFIDKDMREIEAETVSYLICSRLFLETRSAEYLSAHLDGLNIEHVDVQTIISTADRIEKVFFLKI